MDTSSPGRAASPLRTIKTVIRTRDFERSRVFYAEILGLRVAEEWNEADDRGCIFALGGDPDPGYLEISAASVDPRSRAVHSLDANDKVEIQIRTDSVDAWIERLTDHVAMEGPVDRPWGNRYLWIRDPDRVRIALFEGNF